MQENTSKTYNIFLIAGEESGDLLGAPLMKALKKQSNKDISFSGVGGTRMTELGLNSIFPMVDLSVMGIGEVIPAIPRLLKRINQTVDTIVEQKPDIIITIDSPDFCFRVVKKLKKNNIDIPCVHYVAPSVWAWRPGRAKKIAKLYDHLLALLPFEPPYFEEEGLDTTFVGHSMVEHSISEGSATDFMTKYDLDKKDLILSVLPGSRRGEIGRLLPVFIETVELLLKDIPNLKVILPTLPHLSDLVLDHFKNTVIKPIIVTTDKDKIDGFAASNVALAASGTVALELGAAGVPSIIAYKMNPLSSFLAKRLVKTKWVSLINIILQKEIMPEFLLERCRSDILSSEIKKLLLDDDKCERQKQAFDQALNQLGLNSTEKPSEKAAQAVLNVIKKA